ncbi:OR4C46 isoform 1, partial [Pongo abelii]
KQCDRVYSIGAYRESKTAENHICCVLSSTSPP